MNKNIQVNDTNLVWNASISFRTCSGVAFLWFCEKSLWESPSPWYLLFCLLSPPLYSLSHLPLLSSLSCPPASYLCSSCHVTYALLETFLCIIFVSIGRNLQNFHWKVKFRSEACQTITKRQALLTEIVSRINELWALVPNIWEISQNLGPSRTKVNSLTWNRKSELWFFCHCLCCHLC